ncbi:hypothetical protein [Amycolatopsis sp.]|uniref:hypothetical protein n=1 Tax=Amycolatopsis sp. TaxID=37632 RepID=UPI002CD54D43|nr:hypothetical protein [Amycolatopsis sp.]HVV11204.1 hypothetical protein [Amycolatopsis sp.]
MMALAGDVAGQRILAGGRLIASVDHPFTAAGFRLAVISEPQPDPAARELFPDGFVVAAPPDVDKSAR